MTRQLFPECPTMAYTHLTASDRCHIFKLKVEGLSATQIAEATSRNKSTISRELRRNERLGTYCPLEAHELATSRSKKARGGRPVASRDWEQATRYLEEKFSPAQAAGRGARENRLTISHQTIYTRIAEDKRQGGLIYKKLRCRKNRRKHVAVKSTKMGRIPDRVDIDLRPASVNNRHDFGDWEMDTVAGTKNGPVLVTMVERKSGFGIIRLVSGKKSIPVARAMIEALTPLKHLVTTLTYDNGKEFSDHRMVSAALDAAAYFAKPYHAWERGCNENYNGLVRQYFPKNKSLGHITAEDVRAAQDQLNNRPRKRLDWRTPSEVFQGANKNHGVALAI